MKFSDRILSRMKKSPETFPLLMKWIAANPSRQSATESTNFSWLPHYRTAREAKMIIFLGLYIPEWETWEVISRIKESCYFQRYEGEWRQVQELLEQVTDLPSFEEEVMKFYSEDDFFGNFLLDTEKFLKRNRSCKKPVVRDEHRPKKLVYRRGYRDKGSLRPYHQRGRNLGEISPTEDRRQKIQYGHLPDI